MAPAIDPSLNGQLRRSLLGMRDRFFDVVVEGSQSVVAFNVEFSELQQRIITGRTLSALDEETLSLAHAVASTIAVIGNSFVEVEAAASSFHSRLQSESEAVLDEYLLKLKPPPAQLSSSSAPRLQKPSLQSPRHPTTTPISFALATILPSRNPSSAASLTESTRSASDPNPLPEFIEHAYKFFVTNIFNPYPSREEKQAIVDKTNNSRVTLTSISNWFTNARRRCGWAEILKRRCNGNREEMIDLAKRVFVKPDSRYPVDQQTITEFMEMKENVESMYERKTRTSAWIEDLEDLDELVNPITEEERLAAKKRETEEEREARRREKEMLKEQREFERQKRKMQAEALRKADKVAKQMQREQDKDKKKERRVASFAVPYPPKVQDDEDATPEPKLVAGGKRKFDLEDGGICGFPGLRHVSPAYSHSSSFASDLSDLSSDGRVPSLTWSDSGDERPYKRSRSSPTTPHTNSSLLSPALEISASFDYSFTSEPPGALVYDPSAFDSIFDFSVNPSDTFVAMPKTPVRGQKRQHAAEDDEQTPRAKRVKALVASAGPELAPALAPSTPLFTPTPSINGTPTQVGSRRSSLVPIDLDAVLGLDRTHPQPVQITPPDASIPLEVGVFDWSSCSNPGMDQFDSAGNMDSQADFLQLFQLFSEQLPPVSEPQLQVSEQADQQQLGVPLDVPSFDMQTSDFLPTQYPTQPAYATTELPEGQTLDLSGLMTGLMSDEAFNDMGLDFSESVPSTPPDLSRSSSVSPAWTSAPGTPSPETSPTPAELADKALSKERKRRELEEKKAALERERAKLAEMERELEDD